MRREAKIDAKQLEFASASRADTFAETLRQLVAADVETPEAEITWLTVYEARTLAEHANRLNVTVGELMRALVVDYIAKEAF